MKNTGFRIDTRKLAVKLRAAKDKIRADLFRPEVMQFVRVTLNDCVRTTPARNAQLIQSAQHRQYTHRVNYIPSFHTVEDPALIVSDGKEWLHVGGKWYNASHRLPAPVFAAYAMLRAERERRLETSRQNFIKDRMQARFLYRKSWWQVGNSLGLHVTAPGNVTQSLTRRKPAEQPPRGYAQERGGKRVYSVVIYNPFLDTGSEYKDFDAESVLLPAIERHRPVFNRAVEKHLQRALYAVMHS